MQRLFLNKSIATYFFYLSPRTSTIVRKQIQFTSLANLQSYNATAGAIQRRMAGEERQRENMWVRGNADICQEIDNSNKLVAKHSNRLPNGTIVHSNPRLRIKHRISPRCNGCTRFRGSDVRARAIQCVYYLLAGILRTGKLITDPFAGRFYFNS